ncbi:hypothetical protein GETHLI_22980 [Geothrix limicola]|uniref:Uncharacterized protein n=1 Tax=Geothrix limicola TaxID=2927978 RepID=A0ABQ5QHI4_9BACT|nr:hypothetical protein [Geothrix limicola]GLH73796.1 hypothetical protein GETHLI_22980 [Geothrix limicola]
MRALICLCLATGLWAGESPRPGLDKAFLSRILAGEGDASKPWKTFKVPEASASAVVEVIGELTKEELREIAFQEFLAWFHEDLKKFWKGRGSAAPPTHLGAATMPVDRFGGNPVPQNVPLGRVNF